MNRITNAIAKIDATIQQQAEAGGAEVKAKQTVLHGKLDITLSEYIAFQDAKSLAQASGKLTFEEAVTVYGILGNSAESFNKRSLAEKVMITKLMTEILAR